VSLIGVCLGIAMISYGYVHVWSLKGLEFDLCRAVNSAFDVQSILLPSLDAVDAHSANRGWWCTWFRSQKYWMMSLNVIGPDIAECAISMF
jgi:hypothetical protein